MPKPCRLHLLALPPRSGLDGLEMAGLGGLEMVLDRVTVKLAPSLPREEAVAST